MCACACDGDIDDELIDSGRMCIPEWTSKTSSVQHRYGVRSAGCGSGKCPRPTVSPGVPVSAHKGPHFSIPHIPWQCRKPDQFSFAFLTLHSLHDTRPLQTVVVRSSYPSNFQLSAFSFFTYHVYEATGHIGDIRCRAAACTLACRRGTNQRFDLLVCGQQRAHNHL
jgi:hypothetical protein